MGCQMIHGAVVGMSVIAQRDYRSVGLCLRHLSSRMSRSMSEAACLLYPGSKTVKIRPHLLCLIDSLPLCIKSTSLPSPQSPFSHPNHLHFPGVPKEVHRNEARVAQSPQSVAQLIKQGEE